MLQPHRLMARAPPAADVIHQAVLPRLQVREHGHGSAGPSGSSLDRTPVFKDGTDGGVRLSHTQPAGEQNSASAPDPYRLALSPSLVHLLKTAQAPAKLDRSHKNV